MQVKHLDHIVLTVRNIDATVRFYESVLGMTKESFGKGRVALRYGEQKINLHLYGHELEPKAEKPSPGSADLCFITDTALATAMNHVVSHGVTIVDGPVSRTGATGPIISFYFRDPDGNLIEVASYDSSREGVELSKTGLTIEAYNRHARRYTSKFENYSVYKKKIIDFQKKHIPKGANILDLGCGPGNNINTILELDATCRFTGVDLSEELLGIARKKNPGCRYVCEDIRSVVFDSTYDVVLAAFCIVHLTDSETEDLIRRISCGLKEGGKLYLSFMEGSGSGFETTSFSTDRIFFNYYSLPDMVTMLRRCGISPEEIVREEYVEPDDSITTDIFIFATKIT